MPQNERFVTEGINAAFSPDGRRIAFQRLDGKVFKIGVVGVDDNNVEWGVLDAVNKMQSEYLQ